MGVYIRKLKDGHKWRYKGYSKKIKDYYTSPAIYETKEEAENAERAFLAGLIKDSLESLVRARIKNLTTMGKSRHYISESEEKLQIAVDEWGPDLSITAVTRPMVNDFIQREAYKRQQAGHSPHSINHLIRILKALFNWAIRERGIMMDNPFSGVHLMPLSDKRKYIPTDLDIYNLMSNLDTGQRKLVEFVEETGCRINEALRLRGVDVTEEFITLYTRKSKNSNLTPRTIPRPKCLKESDPPVKNPEDRVFSRWSVLPRFFERTLKKMQESLPEKDRIVFSWHNLRHRRASIWAKANMPTFEIMTRLGHNNTSTTMNYLQLLGFSPTPFSSLGSDSGMDFTETFDLEDKITEAYENEENIPELAVDGKEEKPEDEPEEPKEAAHYRLLKQKIEEYEEKHGVSL